MTEPPDFDPIVALHALVAGSVAFVLIGGVAARAHGSPSITRDLDICYSREPDNVERLAAVLRGLNARPRGDDDDVPFILDARTLLAGANFTFLTDAGDLDVLALPSGTDGFDDLSGSADLVEIDGLQVLVATLDDLMRMKRAAGRPKDRVELEILAALRDEIERGPSG